MAIVKKTLWVKQNNSNINFKLPTDHSPNGNKFGIIGFNGLRSSVRGGIDFCRTCLKNVCCSRMEAEGLYEKKFFLNSENNTSLYQSAKKKDEVEV